MSKHYHAEIPSRLPTDDPEPMTKEEALEMVPDQLKQDCEHCQDKAAQDTQTTVEGLQQ